MEWDDAEEIGIALFEANPDLEPLSIRFTDMQRMIIDLPDFTGDQKGSSEGKLEAIQMAWLDEYQDS